MKRTNRRLSQKLEDLTFFHQILGHDLKEPIRKIQNFLSLIQRFPGKALPKEIMNYLEGINRSATQMDQLLEDVLLFSRITDKERLFRRCSLKHIVEKVTQDLDWKIQREGATCQIVDLPEVHAHDAQLTILFTNLLMNALKFKSHDRPLMIQVKTMDIFEKERKLFPEGQRFSLLKILIEDNGKGFNQHEAKKIFLAFQKLDENQEIYGSGLGLTICKKIIENHSGRIYAEGAPGFGAKFTMLMPILHSDNSS